MKLLIVEDSLTARTILVAVTREWGFEPVAAQDGEAAWQMLQENNPPRLMLIDWEMPRLNGLDLCKRIRQQERNDSPFIILLTARSATEDIVEGLEAGANDYVAKPFVNAELQARLQAGQRMLELQNKLLKIGNEFISERQFIENIIIQMRSSDQFSAANIRQLQAPVEKTSGDILLSAFRPDKGQHLMLGDFTGHGLPAAIGGPIVSDVFYSMTAKGLPMHRIAGEINRHLYEKMPTGLFCAAILVDIDAARRQLSIWNFGMEDVLIFHHQSLANKVASSNLALGILKTSVDPVNAIKVGSGDRLYAYSDGITEVINNQGEEFGADRLEKAISELITSQGDIEMLAEAATQFGTGGDQMDDITVVELTC